MSIKQPTRAGYFYFRSLKGFGQKCRPPIELTISTFKSMKHFFTTACFLFFALLLGAQELPSALNGYQFSTLKNLGATPVQNQNKSGTCWVYSTNSFLESELRRMGKPAVDLSEMFVVRAG